MNTQKIAELLKQAEKSFDGETRDVEHAEIMEKFALLVIKEAAQVARYDVDYWAIRRHFGISDKEPT